MTRTTFTKTFSWLAVMIVALTGQVFAQATAPSLVTQQLRLSDGLTPNRYINIRAGISGIASDNIPYFLDQAPATDATKGYSLWLNGANHIVTSDAFAAGSTTNQFWLERVKANGTGLEWVDPATLVQANNGLSVDNLTTPGSPTVQLGGPLIKATSVDQAGFNLSFVNGSAATPTTYTLGNGTNVFNVSIDPSATGNVTMNNMQLDNTATDFLVLDGTKNVKTRPLSSLVVADNGIWVNPTGGFVELGGAVTNTNALSTNRFVTLGGQTLNFDGTGNFNVGDGTNAQNITLDPSATGSTNLKSLATLPTPAQTDRFVVMADGNDKAYTRTLASLVNADNGLIVDNTVTPGTSTVQLGAPATGGANLLVSRFLGLNNQTMNYEGDGTFNLGTTGNIAFNVKTGTSAMTLQGAALASANGNTVHNLTYVDETNNEVHTITTAAMNRNDAAVDFIAVDPSTGNYVKAISPTAGIYRGHTAWNGTTYTQTITVLPTQTIVAGASVTATNENGTGQGTVAIQVTSVTAGAGGSFNVEASDILPGSTFINWVVMNP
ncbi:MAG: hypothetical protein ABI778_04960 [Ignavibacteriota bacterium]